MDLCCTERGGDCDQRRDRKQKDGPHRITGPQLDLEVLAEDGPGADYPVVSDTRINASNSSPNRQPQVAPALGLGRVIGGDHGQPATRAVPGQDVVGARLSCPI